MAWKEYSKAKKVHTYFNQSFRHLIFWTNSFRVKSHLSLVAQVGLQNIFKTLAWWTNAIYNIGAVGSYVLKHFLCQSHTNQANKELWSNLQNSMDSKSSRLLVLRRKLNSWKKLGLMSHSIIKLHQPMRYWRRRVQLTCQATYMISFVSPQLIKCSCV